jgi:hypothetical protein
MLVIITLFMISRVSYKTEPYKTLSMYGLWPFCSSDDTFGFIVLLFSFLQMISRFLAYRIVFTNPHARIVIIIQHESSSVSLHVVFPV